MKNHPASSNREVEVIEPGESGSEISPPSGEGIPVARLNFALAAVEPFVPSPSFTTGALGASPEVSRKRPFFAEPVPVVVETSANKPHFRKDKKKLARRR